MGLLKAGIGAAGGVLADQWREYFYCDSMDENTLAVKGQKRTGKRSSNRRGEDNVISDGSVVAVNEGQCMMIVEDGAVVDVCAEPGQYVYDTGTEPSVFTGSLGGSVKASFEQVGRRLSFGGDAGKDQRVYYFNTKEIIGNKYGTASPVPFRVVDDKIGLDVDISVRCNGEYSYKIVDLLMFYKNVCGNVSEAFKRDRIDPQLKSELLTALQPAFARISEMGIRYSAVPGHTLELADALNGALSDRWGKRRGIVIAEFGVNSIKASEEDEQLIKQLQRTAVMRDPGMAAANLTSAQADAMKAAAGNAGGATIGFMGMNLAQGAGGMNANELYGMAAQQKARQQTQASPAPQASVAGSWTCPDCGTANTGRFCSGCGHPKPAPQPAAAPWTCLTCGSQNTGRFCPNCGTPRPEGGGAWTCPDCGTKNTGRFCSGCGHPKP